MSKKWGTVADWAKAALSVVGTLGALASYKLLPDRYSWIWPVLALVGEVKDNPIITGDVKGKGKS